MSSSVSGNFHAAGHARHIGAEWSAFCTFLTNENERVGIFKKEDFPWTDLHPFLTRGTRSNHAIEPNEFPWGAELKLKTSPLF